MLPLQERAEHIFYRLQTDDVFEHFGKDSRHIVLPTDIVTQEFTRLSQTTIDPNAQRFLGVAVGIFDIIGENGICVRIKNRLNVVLRGFTTELPEHPNLTELIKATVLSGNGIEFGLFGDQPEIKVRVVNPNEDALNRVNAIISEIPTQAKFAVIKGILEIIDDQLGQIMDA